MTLRRIRHFDSYIAIKELSEEHSEYPVSTMCEILKINRAAYYKWKNHANSKNDDLNELIAEKVLKIHGEHPDMGYRRIRDTLSHDCTKSLARQLAPCTIIVLLFHKK